MLSSYYEIPHSPQHSEGARLCKHMATGGARNSNTPRTYDRRGGVRAIVTHRGPTTGGGGGGGVRNSNTPRTYDRRGGVCAIVTHRGPMTGGGGDARNSNTPRTYDRRGCLKKDKYASGAGQGFEKPDTEWPPYQCTVLSSRLACKLPQTGALAGSRGISLFLWRGGRNINNRYSAFEYRYSIVKKKNHNI